MQQVEQTRNIFGFPVANEDDRLFEKTANFFCPSVKKEETSFSTVVTDETKENSAPVTPEKSKRVKICKVSTKTPAAFAKNIGAFENLNNFGDTFGKNNKLPLIIKSNDSTTLKQIQDIRTILPRVFFSQRSQRPSKSVNESASEAKYQAKDLIFTTDISFENENILNLNKTFNESEAIPTQPDTLDQKLIPKNFVIKKSNRNKIQISKFNKIGTFNPLSNSHNLAPSTTQKLPETEINHLQQKIIDKIKPRYLTIEADTSDISKRTIQSIISQIPQSFTFEEHVQKKLATLGTLSRLPNTTTNADLMNKLPLKVSADSKSFKPVITPKRDLNTIKVRAQSPNMMTSLDLNSLISPKGGNARIAFKKERYPASEVLDTQPNTLSKRPSSRFRPQEDLLEKLFNPANQKKKI